MSIPGNDKLRKTETIWRNVKRRKRIDRVLLQTSRKRRRR